MKKLKYILLSALVALPLFALPALAAGDTTPPTAPTNLVATLDVSNQPSLTWTASTDNIGVVGYVVLRNSGLVGITSATNLVDATAATSTTYSYTVLAYDAANNFSDASSPISIATGSGTPDTTPPSVPTSLAASLNGLGQVSLTWATSTDNVGVMGYTITRNSSVIGTSSLPNFLDTSVASNTTYTYTVTASDAAGNVSGPSDSFSITTSTVSTGDTTPPTAPTNLVAALNGSGQISLTWATSTDDIGVVGYNIIRNGSPIGTSTMPSFLDTSVASNTTYVYAITAFDATGDISGSSNSVSITTKTVGTGGNGNPGDKNENETKGENEGNEVNNGNKSVIGEHHRKTTPGTSNSTSTEHGNHNSSGSSTTIHTEKSQGQHRGN